MTEQPTKRCPACEAELPIEQFRLLKPSPRHPTWPPGRFFTCRDCRGVGRSGQSA